MNASAAAKSDSLVTKKVPLKSIRFIQETNPRQDIVKDRVSLFKDIYQNSDHRVPPLEVLLIQGGDPKSAIYLILDGLHRYEALKIIKAPDALCNVHTEPFYALEDLEDRKVLGRILEMSCHFNVDSPLPLTRLERIAAAMRLKDLKYSHGRIAEALRVAERTVERWMEDRNRQEKEELKEKVLLELKQGAKVNEVMRKYKGRVSEFTIMKWKKEAGIGSGEEIGRKATNVGNLPSSKAGTITKPPKPLFTDKDPIPGLKVGDDVPNREEETQLDKKQRDEIISKLVKIFDVIRTSEWFEDADDYVITNLFPLFSEKSARLKTVLSIGGYDVLYEETKGMYEDEKKKHADTTETSLERQALIEELQKELKDRRKHCKHDCIHSKEWARKELHQSLGCHLRTIGLLKNALFDGQITNPAKKVIPVPKEAKQVVIQMAMNASYLAISHFEWAKLHGVHSREAIASFYDFIGLLESFEFSSNKDIVERIRELDEVFSSKDTCHVT